MGLLELLCSFAFGVGLFCSMQQRVFLQHSGGGAALVL